MHDTVHRSCAPPPPRLPRISCVVNMFHSSGARAPWKNNTNRTTAHRTPTADAVAAAAADRPDGCSDGGSVVSRSLDHPACCSLAEGHLNRNHHKPPGGDCCAASPGFKEALALLWSEGNDGSLAEQEQQDGEGGEAK